MKKSIHMKKTLACLTTAGLLLSFASCAPKEAAPVAAVVEETLISVKTQKPKMGDLQQATEYIGTVEPDDIVRVLPKMGGTVNSVLVGVGDSVKQGQLLLTFDTTDLAVSLAAQQAQVEVARASVMTAQAQVDQALGSTFDVNLAQLETGVQQAKNGYASARQGLRDYNDNSSSPSDQIDAQRKAARESVDLMRIQHEAAIAEYEQGKTDSDKAYVKLLEDKKNTASSNLAVAENKLSMLNANYNDNDVDVSLRNLRTSVRNAQLAYDSANTIYELTKGEVRNDALKVSNASLGQAAAGYDAAVKGYEAQAHQLSFAQLVSPIDGIVEACSVTENAVMGKEDVLFTISNKSELVVTFYVSEDAARQLNLGDKLDIESGRNKYKGTVSEIGTMVDSTGLFKIKATVDNGEIMSGVAVKIIASTASAKGILIPQSAIYYENGQGYVYVNDNGKAIRTNIETGVSNNDFAEVITGLDSNNEVIVSWNPNLRDGAAINATPMDESAGEVTK